jgi:hypothetical protein
MLIKNEYDGKQLKSYHYSIGELSHESEDAHVLNMLDLFGFDVYDISSDAALEMVDSWKDHLDRDQENYYLMERYEDQEYYSYSVLQIPVSFILEFIGNTMNDKLTHVEQAVSMAANLEEGQEFKKDLALSQRYVSEIKKVVQDIFQ